jgi:hypothetical protein
VTAPLRHAALWLACLSVVSGARAQEAAPFELSAVEHVLVDDVHPGPGGEPVVDVYFRALTRYRVPVEHLRPVDVKVQQDGAELPQGSVLSLRRIEEAGLGVAAVIALDRSRTMLGGPFERARDQASAFLGKLAPPDRAALVAFSGRAETLAGFDTPLEEVRARLQTLEPDRDAMSTVVFDGIHQAVELLRRSPSRPRRGFAVVFSDGRDGSSQHGLEEILVLAAGRPAEPRLPIFTIGYDGRGAEGLDALRRIAAASNADSAREVEAAEFYDDVLRQMRGSFVLRFSANLDGAPHEVSVEVEGKSDTRGTAYPAVQGVPSVSLQTPWQLPALIAAAVLLALALLLSRRGRRAGVAKLRFVGGPLAGKEVDLRAGRTRIGALAENDVAVSAPSVSRVHAEIRSEGDQWVIVDLDSTNGTRVNGAPVTSAPLRSGDRIRLGEVEALFEAL